ncbi:MAG TPA: 2-isopropylmalate synthase [Planctomycetes bacterium]|nr:2-isopropylmalate synthase [Planctomycetota bacterium]
MDKVTIFDTTLRDGEQSPGASLNVDEKLVIAHQLAKLKVDVIEGGFPIASQGDFDAVSLIASRVRGPVICGLARALPRDIERAAEALKAAERRRIHVFLATSKIHMEKKLRKSEAEVLEGAVAGVSLARRFTDDVEFSPEDASRTEPEFLCRVVEAAIEAGAGTINIPDTVGYAMPDEFGERIRMLLARVPAFDRAVLSVHCHNDLGLAVANSLAAVRAGARQVECTINGLGERAGNASLEEVVMGLRVRQQHFGAAAAIATQEIWNTSRLVANLTGIDVQRNKAVVGLNAFSHEAGIHQHGVISDRETYEIMRPEDVGWMGHTLVIGKHSGAHAVKEVLKTRGYALQPDALREVTRRVKEVADREKQVEEEDIVAIARDVMSDLASDEQSITLEELSVMTGSRITPCAVVKLKVGGKESVSTATGVGPVDAAARALRTAVDPDLRLVEYGLKAITGGTNALAHASIRFEDAAGRQFIGDAVGEDVIVTSVAAMVKGANRAVNARRKEQPAGAQGAAQAGGSNE